MKRVLIVGGAGVFGRRLALGLIASSDAHVTLAGRSLARAQDAARAVGAADAIALDRETATADTVRATRVDLVIDAAGPFQGADLRFARAVIEAGANYLDLADARDFVAAFPGLDALARANGVAAITGASSTPALTHAVLARVCAGWGRIDSIRAGIAPATQMERGPAVMKAILSWTGAPVLVFEDGAWRTRGGWSNCGAIDAPLIGRRRYALAEVPDLDLIPAHYAPRDGAIFAAGLELPIMQRGMEMISALKRWGGLHNLSWLADPLRILGDWLRPFGSDRGGMVVEALGRDREDRPAYARWTMFAPDGLGPYTPTFAALILARRFVRGEALPPGARACVGMVDLEEFAPEFGRHGFTTLIDAAQLGSPFELALGDAFETLAPAVRAAHRAGPVTRMRGIAEVRSATSPLAAFIAALFGLPRADAPVEVAVVKRLGPDKEVWTRRFSGKRMESRLCVVGPGVVSERFGPFSFDMKVAAEKGTLTMSIIGWRIGPLRLPSWLAPRSTATESQDAEGRFRFDVPIALPLIGRLTHYSGWLAPEAVEPAPAPTQREDA
ncbi:MAG: DUF4166 domain-containing protein [Caulobacterales bacterium]|jgi:hypothetical protein|nr:DUF4166 domain-containing protein [Caulobacterales bacterium]